MTSLPASVEALRREVLEQNLALVRHGLVTLTWGNVSGLDSATGLVAIKPSGVDYGEMTAEDVVVVDLHGKVVAGALRPSSDLPTHLVLYREFGTAVGGVVHTHSRKAVVWAQAGAEIPAFGTTHADHFFGPVPCTAPLSADEVAGDYEENTGLAIARRFRDGAIDPAAVPGVLVAGHGPFTWGASPRKAVENAVALEQVAAMALDTLLVRADAPVLPDWVLRKHFMRKHGPNAYYGQR